MERGRWHSSAKVRTGPPRLAATTPRYFHKAGAADSPLSAENLGKAGMRP